MIYKNIFYFKKICSIGGTEQFLYEIAKKYNKYDITIFYDDADIYQLERLRKYLRCKRRVEGEKIQCEKAFYNFNIDMIEDIEAKEHIFVSHAIYQELGYKPPINHPKLTKWIGVSQYSADKIEEFAKVLGLNIKAEKCYNPLMLETKEKVIHLLSATRLDDNTKGGERILKLIDALDRYCETIGRHYVWTIFTNTKLDINSKNVVCMKPRVDVRPYIADADYVLQLSNDMETYCYTINEALGYGIPIVTTPLSILKELSITDNEHIVLDWNCENVDEVAKLIFEKKVNKFEYNPPKDNWEDLLIKEKSNYEEEKKMKFLVEATDKYEKTNTSDNGLSSVKGTRYVPKQGEQWEVDYERKEKLVELGFVTVVNEINEEVVETATKKPKTEKAVKKTTKRAK